MPIELTKTGQDVIDLGNLQRRNVAFDRLLRIAPAILKDRPPESGILGPGTYSGGRYTVAVNLSALGEAVVTGEFDLASTAIVRNVTFSNTVTVRATADAMFHGCVFLVPIVVEAGGTIGCVGCRFDGTAAITNAGVPADANRVGCTGTSVLAADSNVTVTGGV